ncbi:tRNA (adenosine(37)-N6)-threonylcarbamoyltransferase complex dimerization subunit type 1 TsaB [Asticcacaulis sp. AND118]|uniref:tRNA (adenosine(37)-N6)-threonylcarbamoyltransferase complex dimerization subunit type 1 TsaB n=1 Tax=Asticcacaulis sp. AND118 TaxID=2840468 RepID=UPI001CFFEC45|nr:tRNA (adenosine(37)-N6)-threonylcarbamoyltransferase complex dimerization subunit type 1 TsaB [Asticcacaulis sp. AND118]UDF03579.1 tRNA (adenosine(37)-N6)-threonylcarbamoyltransferase complex dimerization subunit type 1 TsaB [Asticcacaulis sp. AND118]
MPNNITFVMDTALSACQVGLFAHKDGSVSELATLSERMTRGHQEFIGPAALKCFEKAGIDPREVDILGVTLGPGSFTGLRVGLSFAKGMASGLGVNLRGFSTLELMGRGAAFTSRPRLVAHNAGRGQIYLQRIDTQDVASAPEAHDIVKLNEIDLGEGWAWLIGSGAPLLAERFPQAQIAEEALPDLTAMAALCFAQTTAYDDLTPLYMRDADAKVSDKAVVRFA